MSRSDLVRRCEIALSKFPPGSTVCGPTVFHLLGIKLSQVVRPGDDQTIHIAVQRDLRLRPPDWIVMHRPRHFAAAWRRLGPVLLAHPALCWLQLVNSAFTGTGLGTAIGFPSDPTLVPADWGPRAERKGLHRPISPAQTGLFTSPARLRFLELVQLADQLLCRKSPLLEHSDFVRQLTHRPAAHGIPLARLIFSHARPGTDSPPETRLRLTLVDGGYSVPIVNHPITDSSGRVIRWADLAILDEMVDLEYQGGYHFEGPAAVHRDRERRQDLDRLGWQLVEVVWSDFDNPAAIYSRLDRALDKSRKLAA